MAPSKIDKAFQEKKNQLELRILEATAKIKETQVDMLGQLRDFLPELLKAASDFLMFEFENGVGWVKKAGGMKVKAHESPNGNGGAGSAPMASIPFNTERFEKAPCYLCGYSGANYFRPEIHSCADFYHKAMAAKEG